VLRIYCDTNSVLEPLKLQLHEKFGDKINVDDVYKDEIVLANVKRVKYWFELLKPKMRELIETEDTKSLKKVFNKYLREYDASHLSVAISSVDVIDDVTGVDYIFTMDSDFFKIYFSKGRPRMILEMVKEIEKEKISLNPNTKEVLTRRLPSVLFNLSPKGRY